MLFGLTCSDGQWLIILVLHLHDFQAVYIVLLVLIWHGHRHGGTVLYLLCFISQLLHYRFLFYSISYFLFQTNSQYFSLCYSQSLQFIFRRMDLHQSRIIDPSMELPAANENFSLFAVTIFRLTWSLWSLWVLVSCAFCQTVSNTYSKFFLWFYV